MIHSVEIMMMKRIIFILLPLLAGSCVTKPDPVDSVRCAANETIARVITTEAEKKEREIKGPNEAYLKAVAAYKVESKSKTIIRTNSASRIITTVTRGTNFIEKKVLSDHDHDGKHEDLFDAFFASNRPIICIGSGPKMGNGILFSSSDGFSVSLKDNNQDGQFDQMMIMKEDPTRLIDMFVYTNETWQAISAEKYYEMTKGVETVAPFIDATIGVINGKEKNPNK